MAHQEIFVERALGARGRCQSQRFVVAGFQPRHSRAGDLEETSPALGTNNLIRRFLPQLILLNFRTHGHCLGFVYQRDNLGMRGNGLDQTPTTGRPLARRLTTNAAQKNPRTAPAAYGTPIAHATVASAQIA